MYSSYCLIDLIMETILARCQMTIPIITTTTLYRIIIILYVRSIPSTRPLNGIWCTHGNNFCRHLLRPLWAPESKKIARQVTIDHSRQLPSGLLISLFCYSTSSFILFPVLAYLKPSPPRRTSSPITYSPWKNFVGSIPRASITRQAS